MSSLGLRGSSSGVISGEMEGGGEKERTESARDQALLVKGPQRDLITQGQVPRACWEFPFQKCPSRHLASAGGPVWAVRLFHTGAEERLGKQICALCTCVCGRWRKEPGSPDTC